jgi:hypothetical protein
MKTFLLLLIILIAYITFPSTLYAAENPLKVPNNKIGVHILFDNELEDASQFVNSNGGDWGYVTIPIQIGDRDLVKWQLFMDRAREHHIIPIIRLASEGDYFNTNVWQTPRSEDIVDFANFLDSLSWPTKNRYIIIFNEPNRGDEWGGTVNPEDYAKLLSFAVSVFKSKSQDYFIISAGMDNAAPDQYPAYMDEYTYLRSMQEAIPGIFNQIDGFASHAYPNPGFAQPPGYSTSRSITSFKYERSLILNYRKDEIPVFITETGWNTPTLSDSTKAAYYLEAFDTVWSDPGIVAITPFLLKAGDGPFKGFSFLNSDNKPTEQMQLIINLPKVSGKPILSPFVLGIEKQLPIYYPQLNFSKKIINQSPYSLSEIAQETFRWMMKL